MARNDYILREAIFIRTLSLMTDGAGLRKHKLTQFDESRREAGRLNLMCDKMLASTSTPVSRARLVQKVAESRTSHESSWKMKITLKKYII